MPEPSSEPMSDIISAKCFGCGHVVKVPGALGGKKARCPKCTNTITIPSPGETRVDDVVSDADLPEVARDDEVLDGLPVEKSPPDPAASPREARPRLGSSSTHRRVPPSGRQPAARGTSPRFARRPKSSTGLIAAIAAGALVLVVVVVAVALSGGKKPPPRKAAAELETPASDPPAVREETEADRQLKERVREFIGTFNRGNIAEAARFYGPDAGKDVTQAIARLVEAETRYKDWNFRSVNASTGQVSIVCEFVTKSGSEPNREVSWTWKNVDGTWYIDGKP